MVTGETFHEDIKFSVSSCESILLVCGREMCTKFKDVMDGR